MIFTKSCKANSVHSLELKIFILKVEKILRQFSQIGGPTHKIQGFPLHVQLSTDVEIVEKNLEFM